MGALLWVSMVAVVFLHMLPWRPQTRQEWVLFITFGPPVFLLLQVPGEWMARGMPCNWLRGWHPGPRLLVALWSIVLMAFVGIGVGMVIFAIVAESLPVLAIAGPVWIMLGWLPMHYWLAALHRWRSTGQPAA